MRRSYNMNFDWDFYDGDIENLCFSKSGSCAIAQLGYENEEVKWDRIQIPHDLRHDRNEYDKDDESLIMQGYLTSGIGWYRKEFFISEEEEGNSISIEFDGVFRNSEVYVNGNFVGRHLSGYTSFDFEISDFIHYGENNVLAVKVDGTVFEGWWYEAVGIYRDVHLMITDPLKFKKDGVFVTYEIQGEDADVHVQVELEHIGDKIGNYELALQVISPKEEQVLLLSKEIQVKSYENQTIEFDFKLNQIMRWDIDETNQYTLEFSIGDCDQYTQKFGMREIQYSNTEGVFLNGRHVKIKGVCVHDDFAGVGGAMSESLIRHKIYLLKQMGCTGYRCSHNPPSPYLLKACDDYGILVMDEVRLMSSSTEYLQQMTDTIKRDRNHPSIFIWSIGNEEMSIHGTKTGIRIVKHMLRVAKGLDTSRPYIYANNCDWREITVFNEENGLSMDVFGFNYNCLRHFDSYETIHNKYPERFMIGTENASTLSTRGQYLPREVELSDDHYSKKALPVLIWSNEERTKNTSAYGETYTTWGSTPMETLSVCNPDYVAGYFVWTGFDYRGEPIPYQWPSVISRFGLMDHCGFMKDMGHHYRVKWSEEPAIHLYPHWTFDRDIDNLEVDIIANTEEVELFVNGVSQGRKQNPVRDTVKYLVDYRVGKERGIEAIGYNGGEAVISMSHKTAGVPYEINLEIVDKRDYVANGQDDIFVKVEVLDDHKNPCPDASNFITFEVTGEGRFLGAGNGDPLAHDDDRLPQRELFHGLALAILRTTRDTGTIQLVAKSEGLKEKIIEIEVNVKASDMLVQSSREDLALQRRDLDDSEKYL